VSLSQAQQMADQAGQVNIIEVTLISLDENRRQATTEAIQAALVQWVFGQ